MSWRKKFFLTTLVFVLIGVILAAWISAGRYEVVEGAIAYPLTGGCEIVVIGEQLQPKTTALLACPGKDLVRLWPLPVVAPWFEDWTEGIIGVSA